MPRIFYVKGEGWFEAQDDGTVKDIIPKNPVFADAPHIKADPRQRDIPDAYVNPMTTTLGPSHMSRRNENPKYTVSRQEADLLRYGNYDDDSDPDLTKRFARSPQDMPFAEVARRVPGGEPPAPARAPSPPARAPSPPVVAPRQPSPPPPAPDPRQHALGGLAFKPPTAPKGRGFNLNDYRPKSTDTRDALVKKNDDILSFNEENPGVIPDRDFDTVTQAIEDRIQALRRPSPNRSAVVAPRSDSPAVRSVESYRPRKDASIEDLQRDRDELQQRINDGTMPNIPRAQRFLEEIDKEVIYRNRPQRVAPAPGPRQPSPPARAPSPPAPARAPSPGVPPADEQPYFNNDTKQFMLRRPGGDVRYSRPLGKGTAYVPQEIFGLNPKDWPAKYKKGGDLYKSANSPLGGLAKPAIAPARAPSPDTGFDPAMLGSGDYANLPKDSNILPNVGGGLLAPERPAPLVPNVPKVTSPAPAPHPTFGAQKEPAQGAFGAGAPPEPLTGANPFGRQLPVDNLNPPPRVPAPPAPPAPQPGTGGNKALPVLSRPPITPTRPAPMGAPPIGQVPAMPPAPAPDPGRDVNNPMFPPPPGAQGEGAPLPRVTFPQIPGVSQQPQQPLAQPNQQQGALGQHSDTTAPPLGAVPQGGAGTPPGTPTQPAKLPPVGYPQVPQTGGQSVAPMPGVRPGMPQAGSGQSVAPPPGYKAPEGSYEEGLQRDYHAGQPYPAPGQPNDMSRPPGRDIPRPPFGEPPVFDQPRHTSAMGTGFGALNRLESRGEANAELGLTQGRRAVPDQNERWTGLDQMDESIPKPPKFTRESTPEDRANFINKYIAGTDKPSINDEWDASQFSRRAPESDRVRRANADLVAKAENQANLAQQMALRKSGLGIGTTGSQTAEFDAFKDKQLAEAVKSGRELEIKQQEADRQDDTLTLNERQQRLQELENRRKDALERRHQTITGFTEAQNLGEHGREFEKGTELTAGQFESELALKGRQEQHTFEASKEQIDNSMEQFYVGLNEKRDEFVEAQNMGRQALEDHREEAIQTLAQNFHKVSGDHMISYAQMMQNQDKMEQDFALRARELAQGKISLDQAEMIAHRQFLVQARIQESTERMQSGELSLKQFQTNINQQLALIGYQIDTRKLQEMITAREHGDERDFISLQNQLLTEIADKNLSREALTQQKLIHQDILQQGRENVITQMQELNRARNERAGESRAGLQERGGGKLMDNASAIRGEVSRRDETRAEGDFDRQNASVNKIYDAGMTRSETDAQRRANQAEATRATDVGVAKFSAERRTGVARDRANRLEGRMSADRAIMEGRINADLLRHETRSQLDQQLRSDYTKMFYQAENARNATDRAYAEERMNDIYQAREKLAYAEHASREGAIKWGHDAERDRAMYQAQADQQARIYMHGSESQTNRYLHDDIVKDTDDYYDDVRDEANMHYLQDQDVAGRAFGARHERSGAKYGQRNARSGQLNQNEQTRYGTVHGAEQTRYGTIYGGRERRNLAQHGAEQDLYGNLYRGREARSAELYRGQNHRSELLYGTQQHRQDNWYGTNEGRNQNQYGAENTRDAVVFDREGRVLDSTFGSRNLEAGNIFSDEAAEHYDRMRRRSQVRSEQFQQWSGTNTGTFRDRSDEVSDQIRRRHEREQAELERASRERIAMISAGKGGGGDGGRTKHGGFRKILGYAKDTITGVIEGFSETGSPWGAIAGGTAGYYGHKQKRKR